MPEGLDDDGGQVGYGRPPRHSQFKKGQSGNPKGRRRKFLSERDIVEAELRKYVSVTENGREVKLTKLEYMIRNQINAALRGDGRAIKDVYGLMKKHGLDRQESFGKDMTPEALFEIIDAGLKWLRLKKRLDLVDRLGVVGSLDYRRQQMWKQISADTEGRFVLVEKASLSGGR